MKDIHIVYVLKSLKDYDNYVGKTTRLHERLDEHHQGRVESTRNRRPLRFIYAEICRNAKDADRRERYLKTAWGKRYLKKRLKYDSEED